MRVRAGKLHLCQKKKDFYGACRFSFVYCEALPLLARDLALFKQALANSKHLCLHIFASQFSSPSCFGRHGHRGKPMCKLSFRLLDLFLSRISLSLSWPRANALLHPLPLVPFASWCCPPGKAPKIAASSVPFRRGWLNRVWCVVRWAIFYPMVCPGDML